MASILIIEDEPRAVSFLSKGLREMGHQTLAVNNQERAIPLARSEMFDLVLLDLILPKLNGVSILGEIRAQNVHVPVIVVTALFDEEERMQALYMGANDYIAKPFSIDRLLEYIHSYA